MRHLLKLNTSKWFKQFVDHRPLTAEPQFGIPMRHTQKVSWGPYTPVSALPLPAFTRNKYQLSVSSPPKCCRNCWLRVVRTARIGVPPLVPLHMQSAMSCRVRATAKHPVRLNLVKSTVPSGFKFCSAFENSPRVLKQRRDNTYRCRSIQKHNGYFSSSLRRYGSQLLRIGFR